jgi:hypothetical protein
MNAFLFQLLLKSDFDNVFDRTHKREIYENFNEDEKRILMQWFEKVVFLLI